MPPGTVGWEVGIWAPEPGLLVVDAIGVADGSTTGLGPGTPGAEIEERKE